MAFDARAYINEPRWAFSSLGLERMQALMDQLKHPDQAVSVVHVAGTNGKGSVCAYIASILKAAGFRVGLFTSPGVMSFDERVQVNGEPISTDDLVAATLPVRDAARVVEAKYGEHPTEFELMAAVAFEHFKRQRCDIAVVEVGLGGRLDATNVVTPEASVIARIGLDHTSILGSTLGAIAAEKAGIIKPDIPVVSWPQDAEAMAVIEQRCSTLGCKLTVPDFSTLTVGQAALTSANPARSFRYSGCSYTTRLLGSYQPFNAALALEAVKILAQAGWRIPESARQQGIADAQWPGRFELMESPAEGVPFIIDGGHNGQGARALVDSLVDVFGEGQSEALNGRVTFLMGVMADKDCDAMLEAIAPLTRRLVTYEPDNSRALSAEVLAQRAQHYVPAHTVVEAALSPQDAIARTCATARAGDIVVAVGSLYGIAALKGAYEAFLA